MKILILTRYSRLGASSRLRFYQYIDYLTLKGWDITLSPLLGNDYINDLYNKRSINYAGVLASYLQRLKALMNSRSYEVLWIEKELFPMLPGWFEAILYKAGIPYVVDYDDAIFHNYDLHPNWFFRKCMGNKIDKGMKNAALVITGNDYLAARARQAGAKQVELIPTVIDISRYEPIYKRSDLFTIGWIGTPATSKYLDLIIPSLQKFSGCRNFKLILVGSAEFNVSDISVETRLWSEETEVSDIQSFDVGIMPLPDLPWERGKCGYKLIQYMACGKPVIASPVGVNRDIVENGVNGFLAENEDDWVAAFENLYAHPDVALSIGKWNREKVKDSFCIQVTAPRIESLLRSVAAR